jgi:hypothetical protein
MKSINVFGMKTISINGTSINTFKIRVTNNQFNETVLASLPMVDKDIRITPLSTYRRGSYQSLIEISYTGMNWDKDFLIFRTVGKSLKEIQLNNLNQRYSWTDDPQELPGY